MKEKFRVQKLISMSGFCSRRKAEDLIAQNKVKVNNNLVSLGQSCYMDDSITIDDKLINLDISFKYYILNKPRGYICSNDDPHNPKTIFELVPKVQGLFSVGRLDLDSIGLIILTNDGDTCEQIIHPSKDIVKQYLVEVTKELSIDEEKEFEQGFEIDDYKIKHSKIEKVSDNKYLVKITEGRNRQIKKMFEHFKIKVILLERIAIGGLKLNKLEIGKFKELNKDELLKLVFSKS